MIGIHDPRSSNDEDVPAGLERGRHRPKRLAQSPSNPIADDCAAELAPGGEPEPRHLEVGPQEAPGKERMGPVGSVALERREVLWASEHHESRPLRAAPVDQTVSRFRPRARLAASTFRPPVVFIRARNPCSLARWRFFGW
jgi:hypothetical protein